MPDDSQPAECQMCGRDKPLTFHHLYPRSQHSNKWFRKRYALEFMQREGIHVCRLCHSTIHKTFSEKELGRDYNTLDKLIAHPNIEKFITWARKQK